MPGILIATFYKRTDETQAKEILDGLSNRITKILDCNPWLMGRLKKDTEKNEIFLDCTKEENSKDYILQITDDEVFGIKTFTELREHFQKHNISMGINLVDKDEKLIKFGILSKNDGSECCIFISMTHVVGDGHTLYQLYKMLDPTQKLVCLDRTSVKSFVK